MTIHPRDQLYTGSLWISTNFVRVRIGPKFLGHDKLNHGSQRFKFRVNPSSYAQVMMDTSWRERPCFRIHQIAWFRIHQCWPLRIHRQKIWSNPPEHSTSNPSNFALFESISKARIRIHKTKPRFESIRPSSTPNPCNRYTSTPSHNLLRIHPVEAASNP